MDQIRSNDNSFLVSSIYTTAQDNNALVDVNEYKFDRSIVPSAVDYSREVVANIPASNGGFASVYHFELPRSGFTNTGHIRLDLKAEAGQVNQNITVRNMFDAGNYHYVFGFIHAIDNIQLRTKKEILQQLSTRDIIAWLEDLPYVEQREAVALVLSQGVKETQSSSAGATANAQVGTKGSVEFSVYIPLSMFPQFHEATQSIDLQHAEPLMISLKLKDRTVLVGAAKQLFADTNAPDIQITSAVLNISNMIYAPDAYNNVLKMYEGTDKTQKITHEFYSNTNIGVGNGVSFKLEGMKNVVKVYIQAVKDNALQPITKIRLTSGNKTILEFNGLETKLLAFKNFKGMNNYKDTWVYTLSFGLQDGQLVGNSFSGSINFAELTDPRLEVKSSAADSQIFVSVKQLSVIHMSTASGFLTLGASN